MGIETNTMFDEHGNFIGDLPPVCITECSAAGEVYEPVSYWRQALNFTVPRQLAIQWLRRFGAWDAVELNRMSNNDLAEKVLWLACHEIKDYGVFAGLVE